MISAEDFFEDYARALVGTDPKHIARFYASESIAADPSDFKVVKNDDTLLEWLQTLTAYNEKHGLRRMRILNLEATPAGGNYVTAVVSWGASFASVPDRLIAFEVTYTLYKQVDGYRILMLISHESLDKVMQKHGLL